jgi:hypothetical protein
MSFTTVVRRAPPRLLAVAALAGALAFAGCGEDKGPIIEDDCPYGIGPAGGVVEVTDPSSDLYGVKIEVEPGAWNACYSVFMGYHSTFTTPNFPDGLEGYASWLTGSLAMEIEEPGSGGTPVAAPDSLEMRITFPIRDLVCDEDEILTAFRYDDAVQRWRVVLPVAMTDSTITVRACRHQPLWTWGKVSLFDADFDLYIAPALAEMHGAGQWAQAQVELRDLYASIIDHDMALNCANLNLVRTLFAGVRDGMAAELTAFQDGLGGACGICDVTTAAFYNELLEYAMLNLSNFFIELLFVDNGPNLLIKVYGFMRMCENYAQMEALDCDFECFFDAVDAEFVGNLACYYAATLVVVVIDYAIGSGWIDC